MMEVSGKKTKYKIQQQKLKITNNAELYRKKDFKEIKGK